MILTTKRVHNYHRHIYKYIWKAFYHEHETASLHVTPCSMKYSGHHLINIVLQVLYNQTKSTSWDAVHWTSHCQWSRSIFTKHLHIQCRCLRCFSWLCTGSYVLYYEGRQITSTVQYLVTSIWTWNSTVCTWIL